MLNGSQEEVGGDYQDHVLNIPVEAVRPAEAGKTEAS